MEINQKVLAGSDVEVEGVVCLELTDPHTGRVLERVESRNAISEWWQLLTQRYGRSLFYSSNPNQTGLDRTLYVGLNHVYLSDSNASLGEPFLDGQMVGWADKTAYAGASTKRGTVIAAECLSEPTFTRYVWEWPTTAANGYIRSVGMCESAANDARFRQTPITYRNEQVGPALKMLRYSGSYYDPAAEVLWLNDSTSVGKYASPKVPFDVMAVDDFIPAAQSASVVRGDIGWGSATLSDVTGDGTNLYVAASTSVIKKFTYPTTIGADPTESSISVSGRTAMVKLAHDGTYLWVSEDAMVYRVHPTTGVIERSFAVEQAPWGMWWYPERSLLLIGASNQGWYGYDLNGNIAFACMAPEAYTSWSSFQGGYYLADHTTLSWGTVSIGYYSRAHEVLGSFRAGTRTVLSSEIEKTNLTGMKLTYTFNFS